MFERKTGEMFIAALPRSVCKKRTRFVRGIGNLVRFPFPPDNPSTLLTEPVRTLSTYRCHQGISFFSSQGECRNILAEEMLDGIEMFDLEKTCTWTTLVQQGWRGPPPRGVWGALGRNVRRARGSSHGVPMAEGETQGVVEG